MHTRQTLIIALLALIALLYAACTDQDNIIGGQEIDGGDFAGDGDAIAFTAHTQDFKRLTNDAQWQFHETADTTLTNTATRFTGMGTDGNYQFQDGDVVGIYLYREDMVDDATDVANAPEGLATNMETSAVLLKNVPFVYYKGQLYQQSWWNNKATQRLKWPQYEGPYTALAYYPYSATPGIGNTTAFPMLDGKLGDSYENGSLETDIFDHPMKELLIAKTTGVVRHTTIPLNFKHTAALFELRLKTSDAYEASRNGLTLSTSISDITGGDICFWGDDQFGNSVNIFTQTVPESDYTKSNNTIGDYTLAKAGQLNNNNIIYKALVKPQTFSFESTPERVGIYIDYPQNTSIQVEIGRHIPDIRMEPGNHYILDFTGNTLSDIHRMQFYADYVQDLTMVEVIPGRYTSGGTTHTLNKFYQILDHEVTNSEFVQFANSCLCNEDGYPGDPIDEDLPQGFGHQQPLFYTTDLDGTFGGQDFGLEWDNTNNQWKVKSGYANKPMVNVTYYGARCFCFFCGGDLPTEEEWELAYRENSTAQTVANTDWHWGSSWNTNYAVYNTTYVQNVKTKQPNGIGAYDMAGNVWEWTRTLYDTSSAGNDYPTMVIKGGSHLSSKNMLKGAARLGEQQANRHHDLGFRVYWK